MKRLLIVFSFIGLITACQSTDYDDLEETTRHQQKEAERETKDEQNDGTGSIDMTDDSDYMEVKMDELGIHEFEVEVEYAEGREFEVEIEKDEGKPYTAEVEDELTNNFLMGREAFDFIYGKIEDLTMTADRSESEIITEIINAFDLTNDYKEIEVEIKFKDGSEIDFEHEQ